jgi:hypothetical protein
VKEAGAEVREAERGIKVKAEIEQTKAANSNERKYTHYYCFHHYFHYHLY